jgi:2-polyprenyl-6-methoxyphenol hydroxylase-like FAD-dependent oxidoreductase
MAEAVVIGGGIGGLTAAAALTRNGWRVTVLERSPAGYSTGAAISLWPNAIRCLDQLGIGEQLVSRGVLSGRSGIQRPDGHWLAHSDIGGAILRRFGRPLVLLERATLVELLASLLPYSAVRAGVLATGSDPEAGVVTAGETMYQADLVVAADGLRSGMRGLVFPSHPGVRYAGYTNWRLLATAPSGTSNRPRPGGATAGASPCCR